MSTCFRLEEIYWTLLEEIAGRGGMSVSMLVSSWARYADLQYGGVPNLSSFIRICCLVHMCDNERAALSAACANLAILGKHRAGSAC